MIWADGATAYTSPSSCQPRHRPRNRPPPPPRRKKGKRCNERTYGWLILHRRLARDYKTLPARSEAMIHLAMTDLKARRLTGENTISWRDPISGLINPLTG